MTDFNPALLKLTREARGWPQTALATASGIGQGSISKYEKGLMEPSGSQVEALAAALGMPVSFFGQLDARPAAVLYRSRALRSARLEAQVRARINLARLIGAQLLADVEIDTVTRFPDPDRGYQTAEEAAQQLRAGWWIPPGPVGNIAAAIEAAGGVVLRVDLGCDEVDAAYLHPLGDPVRWFFVNTRTEAGDRLRFSLAHELGHAILHEVDLLPDTQEAETESNLFAGAFTVPADELRAELPRGRLRVAHLVQLKRRWAVSMGALAMRAHQIGEITKQELSALYREIGWRGYRTREPVDIPLDRPQVFDAALDIHRHEHHLTTEDLAKAANVSLETLEDLFPEHFEAPRRRHLSVVSARRSTSARSTA